MHVQSSNSQRPGPEDSVRCWKMLCLQMHGHRSACRRLSPGVTTGSFHVGLGQAIGRALCTPRPRLRSPWVPPSPISCVALRKSTLWIKHIRISTGQIAWLSNSLGQDRQYVDKGCE